MQPTEDERILAALSHAGILVNFINLAGMIATALIWALQRERSRYVSGHALQSLIYQGAVLLIGLFLMLTWGLCLGLSLLPAVLRPELFRSSPPDAFWLALIGLIVPIGFVGLATLYGLYGALQVYRGRLFLYPLAGRLARRQLAPLGSVVAPLAPQPIPPAPSADPAPIPPAVAAPAPEPAPMSPAVVAPAPDPAPIPPAVAAPAPEPAPMSPAVVAPAPEPVPAAPSHGGEERRRRRRAVADPPAAPADAGPASDPPAAPEPGERQ